MKHRVILIILTIFLLSIAVFVEKQFQLSIWQLLLIYLVPYLLIGHETLHEAIEGMKEKDPFNEHFLMSVATLGAMGIGFLPNVEPEFTEAVFVMLFFQIGELFEGYAEGKSRDSIAHLMNIRPDTATVERNGVVNVVPPETVSVGETIIIKPGEKVPLDGVVVEGTSSLNTVALTGESLPREVNVGDEVISGCVNLNGLLRLQTTKDFSQSTVSKIIELVEHAGENKSKSETFIARFAHVYTPIVVFAALALAILPPFFSESFSATFPVWLSRALIFLVVSCPCALVISVPLTFFGGIGGASRKGILVKGANYMDVLAKVKTVVMDKTGTLTKGVFDVVAVHSHECEDLCEKSIRTQLLHLAAHVEHFSTHPIAEALRMAYPEADADACEVTNVEEIAGRGVRAIVNGDIVCVGNQKMMEYVGVHSCACHSTGTIVHVAINGNYAGHIVISDCIKEDAQQTVEDMKSLGVSRVVMLTGDLKSEGEQVAKELGIDEVHTELLPMDKVNHVEALLQSKSEGEALAFVGDGINDAPVLARADVGIAMGGFGSDAAIEAADVVLMDDHPSKIVMAIKIARHTISIARQNVIFAIVVKVAVLLLAAWGAATMWMAVFADVGVTVLAVLNAMRALRVRSCLNFNEIFC
ncbi:MAG: cadmium-translocating P-type ATPase [Paludibacteraceae bacterium]|nr:cadmium-translocating P-type ATPase [Paludibacteraceae bacterium]